MAKPEFDPNQKFEPLLKPDFKGEEKPAFDPNGKFEAVAQEEAPGAGQAFLEHYGDKATMGYLPQLQAGTEKAVAYVSDLLAGVPHDLAGNVDFIQARDENRKRLEKEAEAHPIASGAGSIAGIGANALLLGKALPSMPAGAGAVDKLKHAGKTGALIGAAANPGDEEGVFDPTQLGDRAKNAAIGGLTGVAAQGLIDVAAEGAGALSKMLSEKAAKKATRALGRPTPTVAAKMAETGQDVALGRTLLDEGAIPVLGTPGRIASRVDKLKEEAGEEVGALVKRGGSEKLIDGERLAIELLDSPELAQMRITPGLESAATKIESQIETLAKNGRMTLEEAQKLRQGIDRSINFNKRAPDMAAAQEGLYLQRTKVRDAMNDAINGLAETAPKDALLKANRKYGNLAQADEVLEREMGRQQANRAVSLTDTIMGAAGASSGSPLLGVGLAAANKFGRTFGNSMQARGYDAIAKRLANSSPKLAQMADKNPSAFNSLVQSIQGRISGRGQFQPEAFDHIFQNRQLMEKFEQDPGLIDQVGNERLRVALQKRFGRNPAKQDRISEERAQQDFLKGN